MELCRHLNKSQVYKQALFEVMKKIYTLVTLENLKMTTSFFNHNYRSIFQVKLFVWLLEYFV